ncbi:putative transmembrane sensor domain protein [Jannaschia seosinensis]|uniref:Putative transmembrane sensor domain protein n=1 Tax=Jannaschia seosinensis TaxID=313367 RepID=A0A0M7BCD2_9RHOB|nr:hypothetical protein [Jannaschia seosinensis]CUH39849.1 putative transmembrane sensor domain protein [Jannaschia seosinensis]
MRRWHFYVMGLIALVYGLIGLTEYVMITFGLRVGWLELYPAEQMVWLKAVPDWVNVVWLAHVFLALVGALCLLAHLQSAVWMLAFAFLTLVVVSVWMFFFAMPTVVAVTGGGWIPWTLAGLVLLLSFLIYIYARQEKQRGEVL